MPQAERGGPTAMARDEELVFVPDTGMFGEVMKDVNTHDIKAIADRLAFQAQGASVRVTVYARQEMVEDNKDEFCKPEYVQRTISVRHCANYASHVFQLAKQRCWPSIIIPTFPHSIIPWDGRDPVRLIDPQPRWLFAT